MAALRADNLQVLGVLAILLGKALAGNVPEDGEEWEGLTGVRRSMDIMLGRMEGRDEFDKEAEQEFGKVWVLCGLNCLNLFALLMFGD